MLALSIFPGSHPPSIVDANELNFCVRDGNRWTLIAINTNSWMEENYSSYIKLLWYGFLLLAALATCLLGDPYRIRTDVNGVRGRCLNHLTIGQLVQLQGLEPGTHWLRVSCSTNWAKGAFLYGYLCALKTEHCSYFAIRVWSTLSLL